MKLTVLAIALSASAAAQSPSSNWIRPSSEPGTSLVGRCATIIHRPSGPELGPSMRCDHFSLRQLINKAYQVELSDIVTAPAWLDRQYYDFGFDNVPQSAQSNDILQQFLIDRFGLRAHIEVEPQTAYGLVLSGPSSVIDSTDQSPVGSTVSNSGRLTFSRFTMPRFAEALSAFLDLPVVDLTEVGGAVDFSFTLPRDMLVKYGFFLNDKESAEIPRSSTGNTMSADVVAGALRQAGLTLKPHLSQIRHLVVDYIAKAPTEDRQ